MQLSNKESSSNAPSLFSTPYPSRKDKDKVTKIEESTKQLPIKKRGRPQSSLGKKNQNQNRKMAKARSTITSTLSAMSLRQHLQQALESLNQVYIGLQKGETKEQINKLKNYTQYIILGENPFL